MTFKSVAARALGAFSRAATAGRARILMYHRFGEAGEARRMDIALFEQQIRHLVANYAPRRLRDVVAKLRAGEPLDRNTVVITVDDGYIDFIEHAYPVLARYEVPATIYVVSEFVGRRIWLWFDVVHWLMHSAVAGDYEVDIGGDRLQLTLAGQDTRNAAWSKVGERCLMMGPSERSSAIERLADALNLRPPALPTSDYSAMGWEELRRMPADLIEIGAHTRTHPILSRCSLDLQSAEIAGVKADIELELGRPVDAFCYPNGEAVDFTDATADLVRDCGYNSAVVAYGSLVDSAMDRYRLERIAAPDNMILFRSCVSGLRHLKRRLG